MSDLSFVRSKEIPPAPAPVGQTGFLKWIRENLFSSLFNTSLTIVSLYFILTVLADILPWIWGGNWGASSLRECRDQSGGAACFSVLTVRWKQIIFGFYPGSEYWRPVLAFLLMILALVPILFKQFFKFIWMSIIYPGTAIWLLWGGSLWPIFNFYLGSLIAIYGVYFLRTKGKFSILASCIGGISFFTFFNFFLSEALQEILNGVLRVDLLVVESAQFGGFLLSVLLGVASISACFPLGVLLALGRHSK